jgi:iduronate 2-sulfatase
MITPNFERLASKSVIFDKAITQIAVCNPARDSLLTGLRPDTVGSYNFQSSYAPHITFPHQLIFNNYTTAGYGKIRHWELLEGKKVWTSGFHEGNWYEYQNIERSNMNSTTMPDKIVPEENFRDYMFTSMAIKRLEEMLNDTSQKFMLALGFKNPHLQQHVPYKYYAMYKNNTEAFKLTKRESKYSLGMPDAGFRCCAEGKFMYMEKEGSVPAPPSKTIALETRDNINLPFDEEMRKELMIGYCASITFVDVQLGRVLDVLDKYDAWKNTVVILTADHGMHNGEKGMW